MSAEQHAINQNHAPSEGGAAAHDKLSETRTTLIIILQLEQTLLRSSSLYPYFMLVAFETGGIIRALLITLFYPFIRFAMSKPAGIKIMTFFCFAGLKKGKFRLGRSVLPKYFLEDVGREGLERVMGSSSSGRKLMIVGVSDMPGVMVEGFGHDYLGMGTVVGRELKVVNGYFVGLMEEDKREERVLRALSNGGDGDGCGGDENCVKETTRVGSKCRVIGLVGSSRDGAADVADHHIFRNCEKVHVVTEAEKKNWNGLSRNEYPKPLIFHDGRLAFRPTFPATLALIMWLPFGCFLVIIRFTIGRFFPFHLVIPCLSLTGMQFIFTGTPPPTSSPHHHGGGGTMYVCNHRTLLDPIVIALALLNTTTTAVTYSLSRFNEAISPLRNVRLTRDRDIDGRIMKEVLRDGDVVVCPEGTTCREPYLLRFSPLFAEVVASSNSSSRVEMMKRIVPVAVNVGVSMFYGSTASGLKVLDPAFHLLNPCPLYSVKFLMDKLVVMPSSRIEVANYVQKVIGEELGFQCTSFTRKDKYMVLAGNTGVVS